MPSSNSGQRRQRAHIEDLAYSGMSQAEIAEKYDRSLAGIEQFADRWAEVIHRARVHRYAELRQIMHMADVIELVGKETLLDALIEAQWMNRTWGDPGLN